jgi:hypothetical protein
MMESGAPSTPQAGNGALQPPLPGDNGTRYPMIEEPVPQGDNRQPGNPSPADVGERRPMMVDIPENAPTGADVTHTVTRRNADGTTTKTVANWTHRTDNAQGSSRPMMDVPADPTFDPRTFDQRVRANQIMYGLRNPGPNGTYLERLNYATGRAEHNALTQSQKGRIMEQFGQNYIRAQEREDKIREDQANRESGLDLSRNQYVVPAQQKTEAEKYQADAETARAAAERQNRLDEQQLRNAGGVALSNANNANVGQVIQTPDGGTAIVGGKGAVTRITPGGSGDRIKKAGALQTMWKNLMVYTDKYEGPKVRRVDQLTPEQRAMHDYIAGEMEAAGISPQVAGDMATSTGGTAGGQPGRQQATNANAPQTVTRRDPKSGRTAVYDAATKQFIRWQ